MPRCYTYGVLCLHLALRKPLSSSGFALSKKRKNADHFLLDLFSEAKAVLGLESSKREKRRERKREETNCVKKKKKKRGCFRKIALKPGIATEHRRGYFCWQQPEFVYTCTPYML